MTEDNRIPEIRAALGIYYDVDADAPSTAETERDDAVKALDRIRAILGDEPPADGSRPTLGEACENVDMQVRIATLTAEVHQLRRELAEAHARKQADLDELKRTLGLTRNTLKQNVEWRDRFRAERDEDRAELGETRRERDLALWLHAEAAWHVVGFDALTAALARFLKEAQAERDALSLLLRGMARKLEAACDGWTEQHKRADALQARVDRCRPDQPAAPLCGCRAGAHERTCPDFRAQPTGEADRG